VAGFGPKSAARIPPLSVAGSSFQPSYLVFSKGERNNCFFHICMFNMDEPYDSFNSVSTIPTVMSTPTTSSNGLSRSESPSPAPLSTGRRCQGHNKLSSADSVSSDDAPMLQRDDVYERTMSWWRDGIRRKLVEHVRTESEIIARMQVRNGFFITVNVYPQLLSFVSVGETRR
jgi:hypothetical protein